jgi:hypothetical protein
MQKRLLLTTLGVGLVAMAGASPASAMATQEIKAHIPFQFEVENTLLLAGDYTIRPLGIEDPSVLVIRGGEGKVAMQFLTNGTTPDSKLGSAELVFDRYGKKEFLHAVLVPDDTGAEVPVSSSEHRARGRGGRAPRPWASFPSLVTSWSTGPRITAPEAAGS